MPENIHSVARISLTYDDTLECHRKFVAPAMRDRGLTGTFYVSPVSDLFDYVDQWQRIAEQGHELGNHTCFHPCRGNAQRTWVRPEYDLKTYNLARWSDEVELANRVLHLIDRQNVRTYGNTCHETMVGQGDHEQSISPLIPTYFLAARGRARALDDLIDPTTVDLAEMGTAGGDRPALDDLKRAVDRAVVECKYLILCFHGVGANTHGSWRSESDHEQLMDHIAGYGGRLIGCSVREMAQSLSS